MLQWCSLLCRHLNIFNMRISKYYAEETHHNYSTFLFNETTILLKECGCQYTPEQLRDIRRKQMVNVRRDFLNWYHRKNRHQVKTDQGIVWPRAKSIQFFYIVG